MAWVNRGSLATTVTVSLSPDLSGNFVCDGVADDVELNAAVDYVEALGGGEVKLLNGTFVLAASISIMADYVNLVGCGTGTVLSGAIAVNYITVGDGATTLTGIVIRNLSIDGASQTAGNGIHFHGASGHLITYSWIIECYIHDVDEDGIRLEYTEHTSVENNISEGNGYYGIYLGIFVENNTIVGNTCQGNAFYGILLSGANHNTVTENTCQGNSSGIDLGSARHNTITGNTCRENGHQGIYIDNGSNHNTVTGNTCNENDDYGIYLHVVNHNTVTGNTCQGNGTYGCGIYLYSSNNNTIVGNSCNGQLNYDGLRIDHDSDENLVVGNTCNDNGRYGININSADCERNIVLNNELIGNTSRPFNDAGTDTKLATKTFPFIAGGDEATGIIIAQFIHATASAKGWEIDAATEWAIALGHLPLEVQQVVRIKIWAVGLAAPGAGNKMRVEVVFNAGASDEAFNLAANSWTHANLTTVETAFAVNDVIHWVIDAAVEAEINNLLGGDNFELKVIHEAADATEVATDAVFRCVEIEYV